MNAYGIHTTEVLIAEVSEADMKEMGLTTGQCERLWRKMNELKGLTEELAEDEPAEDEPVVEDTKEVEDESVEGKLAAANLGHLWDDINSKFEGDL